MTNDPAKSMASNVAIYPGDTMSKAGIVYVVGDVVRPGGFVMENGEKMTLLQAIAMAQGVNRTAALGAARLIRRTNGKPEEIKVPLKGIMSLFREVWRKTRCGVGLSQSCRSRPA